MEQRNNELHLTIIEKPHVKWHQGYKYLFTSGAIAYTAYRTDKGFNDFMQRLNPKEKNLIGTRVDGECGKIESYKLVGNFEEHGFWNLDTLPENAIPFTVFSNGGLVTCYYIHTKNGSKIYRPNPNAKEFYKPMAIHEHIQHQKING